MTYTKETVLDVLMYLFEHYIDEDQTTEPDRDDLESRLVTAGFQNTQVSRAFDWLEELASGQLPESEKESHGSTRIFTADETHRLGTEGMGYLTFLEQNDVLSAITREQVIDRVMALDSSSVTLEQLKWVVLMVLFNQPEDTSPHLSWLEELVYDDRPLLPH
ncbi:MAG: DUF494 family protein [bacterium]